MELKPLIVASHYSENLDWLVNQDEYEYIVYSKNPQQALVDGVPNRRLEFVPNRGQESSSYYKFILDNYDCLPEYIAFCHGHNHSWHMDKTVIEAIRCYCGEDYYSLNNPYFRNIFYEGCPEQIVWEHMKICWKHINLPMPSYMENTMASQFITKRECLLRNPYSFYEDCYDYMTNQNELDNVRLAIVFEQLWYYITTGKTVEPERVVPNILDERGWRRNDLLEKIGK